MTNRLLIHSSGAIIRTASRWIVLLFGLTMVGSTAVQNYLNRQVATLCSVLSPSEFCITVVNAESFLRATNLQQSDVKGQRHE